MKKNGIFLFVISHLVPEIFKIFVLCKLGTDDVIRCDNKCENNLDCYIINYANKYSIQLQSLGPGISGSLTVRRQSPKEFLPCLNKAIPFNIRACIWVHSRFRSE